MKKNLIVDCFAGGGGASVGIEMALGRPVDIAIDHDPDAILMHKTNHPNTLHLTEDIFKVNLHYGAGCGQMLDHPLGTITTKDRFGLVNVILDIKGEKYIIYDIFLRMLKPEELKLMQGFPRDYIINRDYNFKSYPVAKQVARIGNSVVPIMAQKLVEANCPYLKVGERVPNLNIDDGQGQLRFA